MWALAGCGSVWESLGLREGGPHTGNRHPRYALRRASMAAPSHNKMQLTSGGLSGALRAPSSMRRLQLILVFGGR